MPEDDGAEEAASPTLKVGMEDSNSVLGDEGVALFDADADDEDDDEDEGDEDGDGDDDEGDGAKDGDALSSDEGDETSIRPDDGDALSFEESSALGADDSD